MYFGIAHFQDGFRRHVVDGTNLDRWAVSFELYLGVRLILYLSVPMNVDGIVCDGFRDAKVDDLELPFDQDEIGRLQIRMNDILVMHGLHGF